MKWKTEQLEVVILKSEAAPIFWENCICLRSQLKGWLKNFVTTSLPITPGKYTNQTPLVRDTCYQWYPSFVAETFGPNKSDRSRASPINHKKELTHKAFLWASWIVWGPRVGNILTPTKQLCKFQISNCIFSRTKVFGRKQISLAEKWNWTRTQG